MGHQVSALRQLYGLFEAVLTQAEQGMLRIADLAAIGGPLDPQVLQAARALSAVPLLVEESQEVVEASGAKPDPTTPSMRNQLHQKLSAARGLLRACAEATPRQVTAANSPRKDDRAGTGRGRRISGARLAPATTGRE